MADYLQRSARHIASKTDVEQAYALGEAAVQFALAGKTAVMPTIVRGKGKQYRWEIGEAPLAKVANVEKCCRVTLLAAMAGVLQRRQEAI